MAELVDACVCAGALRVARCACARRRSEVALGQRFSSLAASDLASALKPNIRMDKRDAQRAEAMSWQSSWMPAFARCACPRRRSEVALGQRFSSLAASDLASALDAQHPHIHRERGSQRQFVAERVDACVWAGALRVARCALRIAHAHAPADVEKLLSGNTARMLRVLPSLRRLTPNIRKDTSRA